MKKFKAIRIAAAAISAVLAIQLMPFYAFALGNAVDNDAVLNQIAEDASVFDAGDKAIVGEEVGMRGEREKHYRLEDGSYVAAQYSSPVHYMDEDGNWADIDNTLVYEAGESDSDFNGYINKNNSFRVKLAEDAEEQLFLLEDGENTVSMKLAEESAQSSEISIVDNDDGISAQGELSVKEQNDEAMSLDTLTSKAEYENVMPGVDLEYTVLSDGVKEYIVVNEELADYGFSFELALGDMTPRANSDGSISIITSAGEEKYVIPAPYMTDANDRYSDAVAYTVTAVGDGVYTLTVSADKAWIEDSETAFPVKIDPTVIKCVQNAGSVEGAFISSAHENTYFSKSSDWYVGNNASFGNTRTLIKCTVTNMLRASNVLTSAKLKLYQKSFNRTNNPTIEAHSVTSSWSYSEVRWNDNVTFSDAALDSVAVTGNLDNTCVEFDITKAIADNIGNADDDYGIILKASDETLADSTVCFASSDSIGAKPQFEVYYRQQKGLEDDYSYVRMDCGESGTAYINTYNGHRVIASVSVCIYVFI